MGRKGGQRAWAPGQGRQKTDYGMRSRSSTRSWQLGGVGSRERLAAGRSRQQGGSLKEARTGAAAGTEGLPGKTGGYIPLPDAPLPAPPAASGLAGAGSGATRLALIGLHHGGVAARAGGGWASTLHAGAEAPTVGLLGLPSRGHTAASPLAAVLATSAGTDRLGF